MSAPRPLTPRWWHAKWYAARRLRTMVQYLTNWREVWASYRACRPIPPLHFRRGFTLNHGAGDEPILLLDEVYALRVYARAGTPTTSAIILDVGANIGVATLDWLTRLPHVQVHAYEPGPRAFARLEENVRASGHAPRVRLFQEAMAGASGTVAFNVSVHSVRSSLYALPADLPPGSVHSVPAVSLRDAVARAGGAVGLLKLDVEGAEGDILDPADTATLAAVERAVIEYHDDLAPGALARSRAALERAGFSCRVRRESPVQGLLYARRTP